MKRLTTLLTTLLLMSMALWADERVTVSANSSDISEGLDLKVVAKLFAEAKDLEEFEMLLNNPDSAFCNLDLNGDGQVDYLRVVETGEGSKRLIVLQAILAKDIYQDVASIYVEKDEAKNDVKVQIVGDEYVYGTNYIIEPVYVYRPVIYDWFWGAAWVAWYSPWYWGYYPGWWYVRNCWAHDWYWHHCYAYHHHHHYCSFRPGREIHHGYHDMHATVSRRDYANAHPDRAFVKRNEGMTNAREIRSTTTVCPERQTANRNAMTRDAATRGAVSRDAGATRNTATRNTVDRSTATRDSRTFGSRNTAVTREASVTRNTATRSTADRSAATTRSTATREISVTRTTANRSTSDRSSVTTRSTASSRSTADRSTATTRSTASTRSSSSMPTTTRSSSSGFSRSSSSGFSSGASRSSSSSFSSSSRSSSSSFSGGGRSGGFSGGGGRTATRR